MFATENLLIGINWDLCLGDLACHGTPGRGTAGKKAAR
jgi:hypothetical protein